MTAPVASTDPTLEMGRILFVDDDPDWVSLYKGELEKLGYVVDAAPSSDAAKSMLETGAWDVVVLDQKLQGSSGPDEGLELVPVVASSLPRAKTILVSAFAKPSTIKRAFAQGVYDYLEKGSNFGVFLEVKLRNAVRAARAEHLVTMTPSETDALLKKTWQDAKVETDNNRKGKLLEDLMVLLFRSVPGFRQAEPRRKNEVEEIDIVIPNESSDPRWAKESPFILAECKHWSKPVGAPELRELLGKMERRYGRCELGFFIALNGFTGSFKTELLAERKGKALVVLVTAEDVDTLVGADDRNEALKVLHRRAIVELNGHA